MADEMSLFASVGAARAANGQLLDRLEGLDPDRLPPDFITEIERFRARAAATGAILSSVEDRGELQTSINFWTTLLFSSSQRPSSVVLKRFDREAARARAGAAPPYKGLDPFQIEDEDKFFGRSRSVAEMLDRLASQRLLAVLGLSGSGKSSAVRAGLIPRLRQGAAHDSADWLILDPVVPGKRPLDALTQVLRQVDPASSFRADPDAFVEELDRAGRRVLVSIDQFEELFTLDPPEEERQQFIDILSQVATAGRHPHVVVLTMRSEFDTRTRRYEALDALFESGRVQIAALSPRELRSAIVQPADQVGLTLEAGLTEELVQAVVGEPAGLPLLQFALLELWKKRSDQNQLTWKAYKNLGGNPREILAQRADDIYREFGLQEDREISRRIFLALVQLGAGLEPMSRRVLRSELDETIARGRDNIDRVLRKWRENGLIRISPPGAITPESQVEVAHEALIRNWSRLGEWIEDAFASTRRRRLLTEKALAWREGKGELLGELSLSDAETYESFTEEEREYLTASQVGVEQARHKMRRRNRIALAGSVTMAMLTVAAVLASVMAYQSRTLASEEGARAEKSGIAAVRFGKAAKASARMASDAEKRARRAEELAQAKVFEANRRLRTAEEHLDGLRRQEARMRGVLRTALERQAQVRTTTAVEEEFLKGLRTELTRLAAEKVTLEDLVKRQAVQVEVAQGQAETERNVNQQMMAAIGRSDVVVRTAPLRQPAQIGAVAARVPADIARRRERAPLGLPNAPLIVDRRVYSVGFDPAILSPRWVAFTVDTKISLQLPRLATIYKLDPDIPAEWQTGSDAYRNNSYDRGQLVARQEALVGPSESDARASEAEIFYYSITVPTAGLTNRITWGAVERFTIELSRRLGPLHVVAGPVYPDLTARNGAYLTLGASRTAVPLYLYRVLLRRDSAGRWRSLAFLVPNDALSSRDALQFATSVSEIERLTGLNFFSDLPASEAEALKSNASPEVFEG